jgi:hypothetical protein
VAEAWREAQAHLNAHGQPRSVLVVCATHDDIAHVTAAIRTERQHAGELGGGVKVDRYVALHDTLAQTTDPRQFHEGQVLVFHRDTTGVRRHEALEIVRVSQLDEHRRLHLDDGRVVPSTYKQFDYGYAVTAHRRQGQSVDAVVIAGETMSRELFYVAASRAASTCR